MTLPDQELQQRGSRTALVVLAVVTTLFFADVLSGLHSFYDRDFARYHYPLKHILREITLSGQFPYWNPYLAGGQPLAANPAHEVFYPLTWLILLPSYRLGFHLLALAHVYLAVFGMYALLRSLRLSTTAAVFGALSFGLGGFVVSALTLFPFLFGAAWIPCILLCSRRAISSGSRRDLALAALCLGMQFLIGEPTTSLQTCLLIGMSALGGGLREVARAARIAVAIGIAALALSAVQILPAADHFRDSARGQGLHWQSVRSWSTPPVRFGELLYPDLLGDPHRTDRHSYWGVSHYGERQLPFFYGIYPGLLIAVLVMTGLVLRERGWRLFAVVGVISVVLALGDRTPLLRLLYDAGIAGAVRYPEKFLIMGIVAVVVFGAVVLDRLLEGDVRVRRGALYATGIVAAVALGAALVAMTPMHELLFRRVWRVPEGIDVRRMLGAARNGWWIAAARAAILLLLLTSSRRLPRRTWVAMLGLFVTIDLGVVAMRLAPRVSSSFYDTPPAVVNQFPRDRSSFRIFHAGDLFAGRQEDPYHEPRPETFWLMRSSLRPPAPATYGLRMAASSDYDRTALRVSEDFVQSVRELGAARAPDWIRRVAAMSNAWYAGVYRPPGEAFAEAKGNLRDVQPVKFIELAHSPRYYFATKLVAIRDRHDFVRLLAKEPYEAGSAFIAGPAGSQQTPAPGIVRDVREWNNGARLEVETGGTAFLVMSVTPHKYWRIAIDGAETAAVTANIGYQGIFVPQGRHVVEMHYRNPLVATGGAISVAALLLLALLGRKGPFPSP